MLEPERPLESDCCGSGCSPCVLDIYEMRLQAWKNGQHSNKLSLSRADFLSETRFKPFTLTEKNQLTEDVFSFKFQPVTNLTSHSSVEDIDGFLPYVVGQHLILRCYIKGSGNIAEETGLIDSDIVTLKGKIQETSSPSDLESDKGRMVTRAYTPITVATQEKNCIFEIFAKLYKNGYASNYLRESQPGDIMYWRGPYGTLQYKPNCFSYILMLCVGTGLAPMVPIARYILGNECDETIVHLMYGARNINHVILRDELSKMTQYWNFTLEYYFSEQLESNNIKFGENVRNKKIDKIYVNEYLRGKSLDRLQVLICGTETFVLDLKSVVSDLGVNVNTNVHIF